jgi:predicted dehydrogenase
MIRVGICGFGYWGPNLARSFATNPIFRVAAVADRCPERQAKALDALKSVRVFDDADELIDSGEVDAVAIATPVSTHYPLAARALRRSMHVLVEKPLAASVTEAEELIAIADIQNAKLLVDHVYVFHDVVLKLQELNTTGAIGAISYYDSLRVNLGLCQRDMNVLWDLGPHDFSIVDFLFGQEPVHLEATGYCHINTQPDIVYVTAHYASKMIAHFNLSWMSPVKVRRIAIGGSQKMAVWDDLNVEERLKIYNSNIGFQFEERRSPIVPSYRVGDAYCPLLPNYEPLARLVDHFAQVIQNDVLSPVDGRAGLRVVKLLERSQQALDASLRVRNLANGRSKIRSPAEHPVLRVP